MNLGGFSVSLAVKDIAASRAFYEKLGFTKYDGNQEQNWLIMKSGNAFVGLFQDMFPDNILTFNPAEGRSVLKNLRAAGLNPENVSNEEGEGPMSFTLTDPDGNAILFDQHDPAYLKKLEPKGRIIWTDLTVPDAQNVRDFYSAVLGWSSEGVSMGDYDDYNMISKDKTVAGICHQRGYNAAIPSQWMNYFSVEDLDASLEQVKQKGGKILVEPRGEEGHRIAIIEDPAGAVCALSE